MDAGERRLTDSEDLIKSLDGIDDASVKDDNALRARLIASARRLTQRLETPPERVANMIWSEARTVAGTRFWKYADSTTALVSKEGPRTASEVAEQAAKDPNLVKRVLRMLAASRVLEPVDVDTYTATPMSRYLLTEDAVGAFGLLVHNGYPYFASVREYLRQNDYTVTPGKSGFSNFYKGTDMTVYEYFGRHPDELADFGGSMNVWGNMQEPWLDVFPTERLLEGLDEHSAVMVDVGGGTGRETEAFLRRHPETAGRLIVQDRPDEIGSAKVSDGIETMAHDFFTPQSVKDARIYFLHAILHNWPDDKAKEILINLRGSMKPGYSRILAYEEVVKDRDPSALSCGMDLTMMATFGSASRSQSEWKTLFESAGLRLVKEWLPSSGSHALMEVEV